MGCVLTALCERMMRPTACRAWCTVWLFVVCLQMLAALALAYVVCWGCATYMGGPCAEACFTCRMAWQHLRELLSAQQHAAAEQLAGLQEQVSAHQQVSSSAGCTGSCTAVLQRQQ